ncbi:MAG: hypothetical protein Q4B59_02030 [Lachnospiraceae bacterium]|nr:hypothetical protein [Lachnospiraceae bacterium]
MAINPMKMLKMKEMMQERMQVFNAQHPRMIPFMNAAGQAVMEGTVIEIKVTAPGERDLVTNMRVTAEDMETLRMIREMRE